MNNALRIARHEWSLVLRDPRFLIPFGVAPLFLIALNVASWFWLNVDPFQRWVLTRSFLAVISLIGASMAVPLGADTFAGEKERRSWETLQCLPLPRAHLFAGKVLGVLPFPLAVGWVSQGIVLILSSALGSPPPGPLTWCAPLLLTPFLSVFFCALSVLISLRSESVRSAAQVTGVFLLLLFPAVAVAAPPLFDHPGALALALAALAVGATLCLAAAAKRMQNP